MASTGVISARASHTISFIIDQLSIFGGYDGSAYLNDSWISSDGVSWTQDSTTLFENGMYGHVTVIFNGDLFILGGKTGTDT